VSLEIGTHENGKFADLIRAVRPSQRVSQGKSKVIAVAPRSAGNRKAAARPREATSFRALSRPRLGRAARARACEHRQSAVAFIPARSAIVLGVDQQGDVADIPRDANSAVGRSQPSRRSRLPYPNMRIATANDIGAASTPPCAASLATGSDLGHGSSP